MTTNRSALYQAELQWCGEALLDPRMVKPWVGYGLANEGDQSSNSGVLDDFFELFRVLSHDVEHMPQLHQVMISLHGVPVVGKTVFVLVAVMFFHQKTCLYAPSGACAQIAAFMKVPPVQRLAGYPKMPTAFGDLARAPFFDLPPGLHAFDHMDELGLLAVGAKAVLYLVGPSEILPSVAPCASVPILGLERAYGFKFTLYGR